MASRPLSLDECALIVKHVAADWRLHSALKALCLTQRSLVPLCQKHIFESISCSSKKVDKFPDIIRTSPHLFDYIRSFFYEVDMSDQPADVKARRNANTVQLFEKLRQCDLRLLSVSSPETSTVDWRDIDPQLSNALVELILLPSLRSLDLGRIRGFPPRGLRGLRNSPHLETISFTKLSLELHRTEAGSTNDAEDPSESSSTVIAPSQLKKFSAYKDSADAVFAIVGGPDCGDSRFRNLPPVFDFSRLREIYTEWQDDRDMAANNLLISCAPHLEDLFCTLEKDSDATFAELATSILKGPSQTLRELKLYTNAPEEDEDDPFLGSVPELTKLAGGKMKVLESITLNFTHYLSDAIDGPKSLYRAINTGCRSLDAIFADRDAFPALRSLSIYFLVSVEHEPAYGHFVLERQFNTVSKMIKQKSFTNLDAKPTINFSFRLEMEWTDESQDDYW